MITIAERTGSPFELYELMGEKWANGLRVAMPGIVQSFDPVEQTVTVQPAIKERIADQDGNVQTVNLPLLLDVPIVVPRAGGISLTLPVQAGDECLIIFGDMCIDAWWSHGGVQVQAEKRRHDLSDAFCILGVWSQPRRLSSYGTTSAQLRTDDGSQVIDISPSGISLTGTVKINGINFSTHTHVAPTGGGTTSGPS